MCCCITSKLASKLHYIKPIFMGKYVVQESSSLVAVAPAAHISDCPWLRDRFGVTRLSKKVCDHIAASAAAFHWVRNQSTLVRNVHFVYVWVLKGVKIDPEFPTTASLIIISQYWHAKPHTIFRTYECKLITWAFRRKWNAEKKEKKTPSSRKACQYLR